MLRKRIALTILVSLMMSVPALATDAVDVRSAMSQGEYAVAYQQAEQSGTAEGYALAAEILLTEIMLGDVKKNKKQAKRARKLAEAALELDPAHQNARLQYAIADGFVTRETGDVSAWMKKLPQKTEAIVQAYRKDFPTDPRGDALLGAWHLAIARKAGNDNAEKWFDATIVEGQRLFQNARSNEPDNIIIGVNYAFSLLALDEKDFPDTEEARMILSDIASAEPIDHLGDVLKGYAGVALTHIENREIVSDYVGMFLDGDVPVIEGDD